jgi:hypothetical protein
VEAHLRDLHPGELKGPPLQKMGLAQLLAAFGRAEAALPFGYETALNNRKRTALGALFGVRRWL